MNTTTAQAHFQTLDQISGYDYIGEAFEIDSTDADEVIHYYACPVVYNSVPYVVIAHVIQNGSRTYSHVNAEDMRRLRCALDSVTM